MPNPPFVQLSKQHGQKIADAFPPHIPVMAALIFPAHACHMIFLTESVVLLKVFPETILSAHPPEQKVHIPGKFRFPDLLQMAVVRMLSHQIVQKAGKKPGPGKQLRMLPDQHAGLHGSHGKPGHGPMLPVLFYPIGFLDERNDIPCQFLQKQFLSELKLSRAKLIIDEREAGDQIGGILNLSYISDKNRQTYFQSKSPLDEEERSRIEAEDNYTLILVDIPAIEERNDKDWYVTIPMDTPLARQSGAISLFWVRLENPPPG